MPQLRRTENGDWAEMHPARCNAGHPLGIRRMTNGMAVHPDHHVRVRTWTCRACGDVTYADPDELPRGQWGPTADYR